MPLQRIHKLLPYSKQPTKSNMVFAIDGPVPIAVAFEKDIKSDEIGWQMASSLARVM